MSILSKSMVVSNVVSTNVTNTENSYGGGNDSGARIFNAGVAYLASVTISLNVADLDQSIAVNGGDPSGCKDANGNPLLFDQRGFTHVRACDIGAFEYVLCGFLPLIRR